jgi:hypothetical protein
VRVTIVLSMDSSSATSERGPLGCVTDMGVYSSGDTGLSLIGGSGREESSGRGLKEEIEVGVPSER